MTFSTLGGYGRRRRSATIRKLVWSAALACLMVAASGYAYQIGASTSEAKADKLRTDVARFQEGNLELRDRLAELSRRLDTAEGRAASLERQYERDVPLGEAAGLMREVKRQLEAGADPARLGFLIRSVGQSTPCELLPETRRFMVQTPISNGPRSSVRFGDNRINIFGSGLSARDADGSPEAWFDPAAPVHVSFAPLGGPPEVLVGELPLTHKMIVDGHEYRFSLVAGSRAFVEVTGQVCALPGVEEAQSSASRKAL